MRYKVSADNKSFDIEVAEAGEQLCVRVGKEKEIQEFFVDFETSGQGSVHSMLVGGQSYRLVITRQGSRHAVYTRGHRFEFLVEDERTFLMRSLIGEKNRQVSGEVRAPIPGLVSKTLVNEGDVVAQGQGILILEAMKMENEIKAPAAGTVKRISVKTGQNVEKGQPLFVVGEA